MALICKTRGRLRYAKHLSVAATADRNVYAFTCKDITGSSSSSSSSGSGNSDRSQARLIGHTDRPVYGIGQCEGCFTGGKATTTTSSSSSSSSGLTGVRKIVRHIGSSSGRSIMGMPCCGCQVLLSAQITATPEHLNPILCLYHYNCHGVLVEECCKNFSVEQFWEVRSRGDDPPDTFRICMPISNPITPLVFRVGNPRAGSGETLDMCIIDANGQRPIPAGLQESLGVNDLLNLQVLDNGYACGDFKLKCTHCDASSASSSSSSGSGSSDSSSSSSSGSPGLPSCVDCCRVNVSATATPTSEYPFPQVCIQYFGAGPEGDITPDCAADPSPNPPMACGSLHVNSTYDLDPDGPNVFKVCSSGSVPTAVLVRSLSLTPICVTDDDGQQYEVICGGSRVVTHDVADCLVASSAGVFSIRCGPC